MSAGGVDPCSAWLVPSAAVARGHRSARRAVATPVAGGQGGDGVGRNQRRGAHHGRRHLRPLQQPHHAERMVLEDL